MKLQVYLIWASLNTTNLLHILNLSIKTTGLTSPHAVNVEKG